MASNYHQDGKALDCANAGSTTIASGAAIKVGTILGIALVSIAPGATGAVAVEGTWKIGRTAGQTYAQGDALYWDDTTKLITTTAASNIRAGFAAYASTTSTSLAYVRLAP